ncbi:MAG: hypothetical protein Q9160_002556 [Pyrenula sp. 1 TL-2023]
MQYKSLSVALASSLVAGGAWFLNVRQQVPADTKNPVSSQSSSFSTSSNAFTAAYSASESAIPSPSPSAKRRALVVDNDQFYTGSIEGDEPLSKDTDDYGRKVLEMMTPDDATTRLRKKEESYLVNRGRGVVRYDIAALASNDPIEDDHAEKVVEVPNTVAATDGDATTSDWMFWGVFDGHSGWTTSAKLRQALISFVARELNTTYKSALTTPTPGAEGGPPSLHPAPSAIDSAIRLGFLKLDHEICHGPIPNLTKVSKSEASASLAPALSGSCGLLSFYDTRSKIFRVACTGDSRAVLGRRNPSTGKWTAKPLSEDQTGSNPQEEARMRAEHPDEQFVVRNGRVLGQLEPTRAFGDAIYKWTKDIQAQIKRHFFGRTPSPLLKTPPYVTAEPVVTSTQIEPSNGDFVVLATDGLWEMLTNEEVVGLVGQWIEVQNAKPSSSFSTSSSSSSSSSASWLTSWFSSPPGSANKKPLPVEKGGNSDKTGQVVAEGASADAPIRQQQWHLDPSESAKKRWTVEDANVATHLVRNALGGRDTDMVCALLTLPSPYSRRYRDDLTVEVVFFGEAGRESGGADGEGGVRVNEEASTGLKREEAGPVKAKL